MFSLVSGTAISSRCLTIKSLEYSISFLISIADFLPLSNSSKELFKKFNISITPTATAYYKTKDKEISSVLEKGFITQSNLIHNYQHFLVYNDIVEQKEFHSAKILTTDIKDKLNEK